MEVCMEQRLVNVVLTVVILSAAYVTAISL